MPVTPEEVDAFYEAMKKDAESAGYRLNPDAAFTKQVLKGLLVNKDRYNILTCPCRLGSGMIEEDADIICPCDYRDADIEQYGSCYCGLYVSDKIYSGQQKLRPLPDRRPPEEERQNAVARNAAPMAALSYPVYRCKVCGYLCAREEPPGICPICKAKDRFEKFI